MKNELLAYPGAKINLGLYVFGKRPDGFHGIESIFLPVGPENSGLTCDALKISELPGKGDVRMIETGIEYPGNPEDNICVRAYRLISSDNTVPSVQIELEKHIPVGAGLGGGSSDGVCTLLMLNKMFSLNLGIRTLAEYAEKLGSDCPFFLLNSGAMLCTGRGEILEHIDSIAGMTCAEFFKRYRIELVFPGIHVSTGHAYSIVPPRAGLQHQEDCLAQDEKSLPETPYSPLKELISLPVEEWQGKIANDFEAPVFKEHPELQNIKDSLLKRGALYASMTGSGSAIFGIFRKQPAAAF